jgi:hypothetical protein
MPWVPASRTSSGYGSAPAYASGLQRQQAHLRAVAMHDHDDILGGQRRDRFRGDLDVLPLDLGGHRVTTSQQRIAAQGNHDPHLPASLLGYLARS